VVELALSSLNGRLGQRRCNGHSEDRKVYKFPEGFDFVQTFPDRRTAERVRKLRQVELNPPPKKRKAEPWTMEDLERYRRHFGGEDLVILNSESNSKPANPHPVVPEQIGGARRLEKEGKAESETLDYARRGLPQPPFKGAGTDLGEDTDGFAQLERDDIEGENGTSSAQHANFTTLNENDTFGMPAEPQSTSTTLSGSESDPESNLIVGSLNDVHEEAQLSFRADMDPATHLEHDEELERAMQHFNLGMWNRPWRPPPRLSQDELKKESEKELSKKLELQKEQAKMNRTIHVLGLGTVGKLIAHSLAGLPNGPPVTLLMHRPLVMQQWHDEGAAIKILINGEYHVQTGFHIESSADFQRQDPLQRFPRFGPNLEHSAEPPNTVIDSLVVTTNPCITLSAISSIKHRLRKTSTICFVQDGLGIIEKMNSRIFPDPHDRPTYVLGRITHDVKSTDQHFTIVENRIGSFLCAKLPQVVETKEEYFCPVINRTDFSWSPQARHLVGSLIRTPGLNAESLGHKTFFVRQLRQLAVGAVIGPLSVAYDCSNDELLYDYAASQNIGHLVAEICHIILSLPELAKFHKLEQKFNANLVENIVLRSLQKSGRNTSAMLQDIRAGRRTDIDFYNGYLVQRAMELGVPCPRNHTLLHLVKGRQARRSRQDNLYIPFRG
jgi:2-dehydropantoate 2-reductase